MSLPVFLRPEAEDDLVAAKAWYGGQRGPLGDDFLDEVSAALQRIGDMPQMYDIEWRDVRPVRIRRFPYVIYYRILPARVEVLAVLHGRQDPAAWQSRA